MQAPQRGTFKLITEKQQRDFRLEQAHLRALARQQHESTLSYRALWLACLVLYSILGNAVYFGLIYLVSLFCK